MEVPPSSGLIALTLEAAASTPETSVNLYQTKRCNIPENRHLHSSRCQGLKFDLNAVLFASNIVRL
jgi:hypothetical protein